MRHEQLVTEKSLNLKDAFEIFVKLINVFEQVDIIS